VRGRFGHLHGFWARLGGMSDCFGNARSAWECGSEAELPPSIGEEQGGSWRDRTPRRFAHFHPWWRAAG
jgi:hypothetical protein